MSIQLCQEAAGEFRADNRVDLRQEPTKHEHQFTPVWQSDGTLVDWCHCGQERECDFSVLEKFLHCCIRVKSDYLRERDKSISVAQKQKFAQAAADKDKQIAWLEEQIEKRSPGNSSSTLAVSYLALDEIRRDGGTQPRAAIDLKHVKLLEEQIEDDKELEPVVVFYDGESYWLADGFHRYAAHKNQDKEAIACVIHQGTRREAVLYSVGANADHKPALPRSREDKRRAVMTLLQDPEWGKWSDREIAERCKVHHNTVGKIRASLTGYLSSEKRTYKTKHSTTAKMNIANIGKSGQELPNPETAIVELGTGEQEPVEVEKLKPAIAQHLQLAEGKLVEICVPNDNKINGRWGRTAAVTAFTVEVWLRDVDTIMMQKYTLKYQQLIPLPLEKEPQLKKICDRISCLRQCNLDPFEVEILDLLERPVVLTPTELEYLAHIEKRHGIAQNE
ncbi:ParB N-terminal domain-containing protein [Gloeocapsa sp. BRSZ]